MSHEADIRAIAQRLLDQHDQGRLIGPDRLAWARGVMEARWLQDEARREVEKAMRPVLLRNLEEVTVDNSARAPER